MSRRVVTRRAVCAALMLVHVAATPLVLANGEAEYVAPLDRPVASAPDRALPYPIVEEPSARGIPALAADTWPNDFAFLTTPNLASARGYPSANSEARDCFESIVLRGTKIEAGKIVIPAGGLSYVAEAWNPALPFRQDVICIAGIPHTLIDFEQSIVTRKAVTLGPPSAITLGSEIFRLRSITEFGNARSAVLEITSLSGFDWARLGTGSLEVSTTEPGWHAKTFHYGLHQGRVEEVTPNSVRFAWLSGLRTDSVLLARKRESSSKLGVGGELSLTRGGRFRVVRIDPFQKVVDIETPDGPKSLSVGDLRSLPADTPLRKKLLVRGPDYAVVLVPEASDFAARQVHLEVYTELRQYRHADVANDASSYKTFPFAHYTGGVVGIQWVNDQPVELKAGGGVVEGPYAAFKLHASWEGGELKSLELEDKQAAKSGILPLKGRTSINLLAGAGPTLDSILARSGANVATALHELWARTPVSRAPEAKVAQPIKEAPPKPSDARSKIMDLVRTAPALLWALAGLAIGLILGYLVGRAGRKVVHSWE